MDIIEKIKKMTAKEKSEYFIRMQPAYASLIGNEKTESNYKERLNTEISKVCRSLKIKSQNFPLFYKEDYNLCEEWSYKRDMLSRLASIKKRFTYYKKTEKESIEADATVDLEHKKDMQQQLDDAIKNINYKIDVITRQFNEDIERITYTVRNGDFKEIFGQEVEIRKEQTKQMGIDIRKYCIDTLCDAKDLLKVKNLKLLNKNYEQIVARTLKNLVAINNSEELAKLFIKEFNQNVKMEKAII